MEHAVSGAVDSAGFIGHDDEVVRDGREDAIFDSEAQGWRAFANTIRAAFRLARTGLHLLWGMATVALAFPFLPVNLQRALKTRWSRQLLDALGVSLRTAGTPPTDGLVVANHVSWLDVYAINALAPTAFVAKDDVRGWPLIGWLSSRTETMFIERGSRAAAMRIKDRLTEQLREGACVALFPEGTTSAGSDVLPFHSALFQAPIDSGARIAPIAVRYTGSNGKRSAAPVYIGETSLWQSLRAIANTDGLTANLCFLPSIDPEGMDRRQIAEQAGRLIAGNLVM
jgi:1-acyl-sn-glycerol-3-phosphate acyltransferase